MKKSQQILPLTLLLCITTEIRAQPTPLTYQGRLTQDGMQVNGFYDLRFTLFDAATSGTVVGSTLTNAPVGVSNGLFTVALDFGGGVFDGGARWLEIGVRTNASMGSYVT